MKKTFWAFIGLLAPILAIGQEAAPLTLEEAVRIAKQNAYAVLSAEQDVEFAKGGVQQARSALLPKLNANGTYTRYTSEISAVLDPKQPPIIIRPLDQKSIALQLVQAVDIWGISGLALGGARALEASALAMLSATLNDVALKAKTTFLDVLRTDELLQVAEERVVNVTEHLRVAKVRNEAGQTAKFDVFRFEAELASSEQERLQALNNALLAEASFNEALSRDVSTPVELIPPTDIIRVDKTIEELTEKAKESRPELIAAQRRFDFQNRLRRAREKGNLPALNLTGNFSYDPEASGLGGASDSISATAALSFPIFDGGLNRSLVRQARADETKAKIALDQATLGVTLEVKQAHLNLISAEKQVETAEKGLISAREALRVAELRYQEGVGTPLEVSDANAQFVAARTAVVNAVFQYRIAVSNLQRAVGSEEF
ncbi:MAG: TolC family protein [Armatimonadota bacterium]|nr:TolC family protein [Armatimonadota bacterium]